MSLILLRAHRQKLTEFDHTKRRLVFQSPWLKVRVIIYLTQSKKGTLLLVLSRKHWRIKPLQTEQLTPQYVQAVGGSLLLAKLLAVRGMTDADSAKAFLDSDAIMPQSPEVFEAMPIAVSRLVKAIEGQESILIYGDFDVDGVTGTSILLEALETLGAKVSFYLPSRHEEGHGMNTAALCRLVASRQVKVLVTTDNGTGNFNEVNLLNGLGVDTIITDHHEYPENLPFALAILNPLGLPKDHPCRHFSGAGMSFQLVRGLYAHYKRSQADLGKLLDLMMIGTIVDMVALKGDNRYWVRQGLVQLNKRERLGLRALLKSAGVDEDAVLTTTTIGFTLGPRLNAIGRMIRADEAVELLTTQDPEKARVLAEKLEHLNRQRQDLVEDTEREARQQIEATGAVSGQSVIIVASPHWNVGIVGLVATRLVEAYSRPVFVGVIDESKGLVRFSGRSIPSVHLTDTLGPFAERFEHWGGHAAAAGFSVKLDAYSRLKSDILEAFNRAVPQEAMLPVMDVDLAVEFEQISLGFLELVSVLTPFGQGNPEPVLMLENVRLVSQKFLGQPQEGAQKLKRHLKLILQAPQGAQKQSMLEAVYWGWQGELLDTTIPYDIAFKVSKNTYQGSTKLQLVVEDIRIHGHVKPNGPQAMPEITMLSSQSQPEKIAKVSLLPFELVDARELQKVEPVLLELMQAQRGLVFSEGTKTFMPIPFSEEYLCTRLTPQTAIDQSIQTLLLWDYPTDMETLVSLLTHLKPSQLHIMGAKYRYAPLLDSPMQYLKGVRSLLLQSCQQKPFEVSVQHLAKTVATSKQALMAALSVFSSTGLFNIDWEVSESTGEDMLHIQALELPEVLSQKAIESRLEYQAYVGLYNDVLNFRRWWMQSPLSVIESSLESSYLSHQSESSQNHLLIEVPR